MAYRREIDGLRAIAVLSVLVFHFYPEILPHGYLGVDLFFVISGFLISLYIIEESDKNFFSFFKFYVRRIRRILPVTLGVLGATLIVGLATLTDSDLDRFLKSLIATLTFTVNIFFWRDGGYFGTNDALKPLLHMWSLGVEEQFYLIFPLVFVLVLKSLKASFLRLTIVTLLTLLSFLGNYYLQEAGGATPAFFLTPFRAWQFGIGSLAALAYYHFPAQHAQKGLTLSILGLGSGLSIFPDLITPGFLVTISTAFFLSKKYNNNWILSSFLSNKIMKKIGSISFSLYLWHWPILVFIRYISIDNPSSIYIISGVIATFALSLYSYRFIEEPFRRKLKDTTTIKFVLSTAILLLMIAITLLDFDSLRNEKDKADVISRATQTNYRCDISEYMVYGGSRACLINKELNRPYEVALVGNSHAQMYVPSIQGALRRRGQSGLLIPLNACLPTTDINISTECLRLARLNYGAFMSDANVKIVIFGLTWYQSEWVKDGGEIVKDPDKIIISKSLIDLVKRIRETGREVYLIGPIQTPGYDLPSILSRRVKFGRISYRNIDDFLRTPRANFDADFKVALDILIGALGDRFIRASDELCDDKYCYFGNSDGVYFSDNSHLSRFGALKMEKLFHFLEKN